MAGNMFQLNQTTLERRRKPDPRLAQIKIEVGEHEANARAG